MYRRALDGYEKALGADHPSTLSTVNNLGNLLKQQGKYDEAYVMYRRALDGREKALGADHLSTLDTVNNLGILLWKQDKLDTLKIGYHLAKFSHKASFGWCRIKYALINMRLRLLVLLLLARLN